MTWEKVEQPRGEIKTFSAPGETIEGVLKNIRQGKFGPVYDIMDRNGKLWSVFASTVLADRMQHVNSGETIKIEYKGDEPAKKAGRKDTKIFDVFRQTN